MNKRVGVETKLSLRELSGRKDKGGRQGDAIGFGERNASVSDGVMGEQDG